MDYIGTGSGMTAPQHRLWLSPLQFLEIAAIALGPLLVRMPTYSGTVQSRFLYLAPILLVGGLAFTRWLLVPAFAPGGVVPSAQLSQRWKNGQLGAPFLFGLLFFFGVILLEIRGAVSGRLAIQVAAYEVTYWLAAGSLILGVLLTAPGAIIRAVPIIALVSVDLFVLVNFLLRYLGFPVSNVLDLVTLVREPSTLAGILGLTIERDGFPLGNGVNGFGAIAGVALVGGLLLLLARSTPRWERLVGMFSAFVGLAGVLAVDSRFAFLAAVSVVACLSWWPSRWLRHVAWVSVAAIALPWLTAIAGAELGARDVSGLPIRGSADLYTLNGRTFIWAAVGSELLQPRAWHLIGAGYEGAQVSGVIYAAGDFVGNVFDIEHVSVHNAMLQQVMDAGYLGLTVFILGLWWAMRSGASPNRAPHERRVLVGVLAYIVLVGVTETVPSPAASDVLFLYMLLGAYGALTRAPVTASR